MDPQTDITVTCGATEGMIAVMLALLDPGDEVVVFEPFYENYGPDAILSGAVPKYVTLHEPDWSIDFDELRAAFGPKTRAVVLNSPHNPTGKVFTRAELERIAALCQEFDCYVFTDDIYEHITFGPEHIPMATMPGMAGRTVAINSLSKTYSVTGWRVGWVIAPAALTAAIRKVHDFLTVGAAAPLQAAGAVALRLPDTLLPLARRGLPRAPRHADCSFGQRGLPDVRAQRRVLRDDRHLGPDRRGRRHLRAAHDGRAGCRDRARIVVLLTAGAGPLEGPLRLPEEARNPRSGAPPASPNSLDKDQCVATWVCTRAKRDEGSLGADRKCRLDHVDGSGNGTPVRVCCPDHDDQSEECRVALFEQCLAQLSLAVVKSRDELDAAATGQLKRGVKGAPVRGPGGHELLQLHLAGWHSRPKVADELELGRVMQRRTLRIGLHSDAHTHRRGMPRERGWAATRHAAALASQDRRGRRSDPPPDELERQARSQPGAAQITAHFFNVTPHQPHSTIEAPFATRHVRMMPRRT